METIQGLVAHTSIWVYLLLLYLLLRCARGRKIRVVSFGRLYLPPFILVVISLNALFVSYPLSKLVLFSWILAILIGASVGWLVFSMKDIKADPKKGLIQLSGSSLPLILIMLIFVARYYFGYRLGTDPALMHNMVFAIADMSLSAVFTGIFVGRFALCVYRYKNGPFVELERRKR